MEFSLSDSLRVEAFEKVTEHDTAAAGDYLKVLIARAFPRLEQMMEGVHFANTSEDAMSVVFGVLANKVAYGHFIPAMLNFMVHYLCLPGSEGGNS